MKPLLLALAAALAAAPCARAAIVIDLNFTGPVSTLQQQTFRDAANYWKSALTGYDLIYDIYGLIRPHALSIDVSIPVIDGEYGILGGAGLNTATWYQDLAASPTTTLFYSTTGAMEFDVADVPRMMANNQFYGVVLHEMAHILGIGPLWTYNGLYTTASGQYTGANALAAWKTEFNRPSDSYVPVELGGGTGTANVHWNEVDNGSANTGILSQYTSLDFSRELMTGWASPSFFVSTTTLGAMKDLGYTTNYSYAGVVNYVASVPEPSRLLLGGTPLLLLAAHLLRRRRTTPAA